MDRWKKKAYAFILGLCGLVLLIDRLLALSPSGPAAASASAGDSLRALGVELGGGPGATVVAAAFPSPLPPNRDSGQLRDVFLVSDAVRQALVRGVEGSNADHPDGSGLENGISSTGSFAERFRLRAVLLFDGQAIAVVGSHWLKVGEDLEGHRLSNITGTTATFDGPAGIVTLSVIDDS